MAYEINFCETKEQLKHLGEVVTGKTDGSPNGADIDTSTLAYTGQERETLPALLQKIGLIHTTEWSTNPLVTKSTEVIPYAGTNQLFRPTSLPYQVDSSANPDPNALVGTELVDVSKFATEKELQLMFSNVDELLIRRDVRGIVRDFSVGDIVSTPYTNWVVNSDAHGLQVLGGLYVKPVGDIHVNDFGAVSLDVSVTTSAIQTAINLAKDFNSSNGVVGFSREKIYNTDKPIVAPCGVTLTDYSDNNQGMGATINKTTNSTDVADGYPKTESGKSNEQDAVVIFLTTHGKGYRPGSMNNLGGKGGFGVNLTSSANCAFGIYGYSINNQLFKDFQITNVQEGYFSWNSWKQKWSNVLVKDVDRIGTWEYDGIFNTTMKFEQFYCHSYRERAIKMVQCRSVTMDQPVWESGEGQMLIADARTSVKITGIHLEGAGVKESIVGKPVSETALFYANSTSNITISGGFMLPWFNPTVTGGESAIMYAKNISKVTLSDVTFDVYQGEVIAKGVSLFKVDAKSSARMDNVTPLNTQVQMLGGGANVDTGGSFVVNGGNLTRAYLLKRLGFPCSDSVTDKAHSPIDAHVNPVSGLPENNGTSISPKKTFNQVYDLIRHCNSSDLPSKITLRDSDVNQDLNIAESTIPMEIDLGGFSIDTINISNSHGVVIKNGSADRVLVSNSECIIDALTYRNATSSIQASQGSQVLVKGNSNMQATSGWNVQLFDASRLHQYGGSITGRFAIQTYGGIATVSTTPTATEKNDGGQVFG